MAEGSLRAIALCLVLAAALFLAACDSSEETRPSDVAGEYIFTEFRFEPDSPLLPPANLLDTLVTSNTRLQLFSSGRFTLLYQFSGANPEFIGGDFEVSDERIRVRGREDEASFYGQLLLAPEFTLQREGSDAFHASIRRTVDLEKFSPAYRGLRSVEGAVKLRLVPR